MEDNDKITIEIHSPPIVYKIDVDDRETRKAIKKLSTFAKNNNKSILEIARVIAKLDPKAKQKYFSGESISCRLPGWFYKIRPDTADAIALIMYFTGKPLTMGELTSIINRELKKIDLRNVSKHLTSKGKGLYGYTTYDEGTERYALNDYGKKWIENELLPKLEQKSSQNKKR